MVIRSRAVWRDISERLYARPYWRYRYAYRLPYYRSYRRFDLGPGRSFGVGPGAYECYGYDRNW